MATNSGITAAKRRRAGNDANAGINEKKVELADEETGTLGPEFKRYTIQNALQLTLQKLSVLENAGRVNTQYNASLDKKLEDLKIILTDYRTSTDKALKGLEKRIDSLESGHVVANKLNLKDVDLKVERIRKELDTTRNIVLSIQNSVLSKNMDGLE